MLEKIYCHKTPKITQHKLDWLQNQGIICANYGCKEGNWYHYITYSSFWQAKSTKRDIDGPSNHGYDFYATHFDIKETNNIMSKTILCLHIDQLPLYFWTKEQYRNNIINQIIK